MQIEAAEVYRQMPNARSSPLDQPCAALTMNAQASSSVYGWGTLERFFATSKSFSSGTKWLMSAARGGRKSSRPVCRMTDMFPLRRSAREKQKGRWRPISLVKLSRPPSVAAYAFSRLFRCFRYLHHGHVDGPLEALLE